jgi:protein-tyrosine phosphatase
MHWRRFLFVDIHNHILPGIDDGAPTMGHAVEMARQAVSCGTDVLVATPHRAYGLRRSAPPDWIRRRVADLQASLDRENVPLRIAPGVEIPVGPRVAAELTSGALLTLGDAGRWALIEPPFDRIPHDALDSLRQVLDSGIQVILAHPERNAEIQRSLAFVESCAALGLAFQLTTGSLLGRFGPLAQRAAEAILAHAADWPLVIASDTHDLRDRSSAMMALARDRAAEVVGEALAQDMVDSRPRSFLESSPPIA